MMCIFGQLVRSQWPTRRRAVTTAEAFAEVTRVVCHTGTGLTRRQVSVPCVVKSITNRSRYNA